jgi:signal transduction histidine kinase
MDWAFQWVTHDVAPGLFLLPAVILAAAAGGPPAGLAAAAVSVLFAICVLSRAGPLWHPPFDRTARLVVLCVSAPTAAVLVGLLRRRVQALTAERLRAERDRADAHSRAVEAERRALVLERDALARTDRQNQQRLANLIEAVPGVVWEATVGDGGDVRVTFISRFVEQLLGYPLAQWTDSAELWASALHPDDRDRVNGWVADARDHGATSAFEGPPIEFRWVARDGTEVWVESRASAVPGPPGAGHRAELRGVTSDIRARHRLEAALRDRAAELASVARRLSESNDELDQFAYVTSHDLKAPLRGISNLTTWIEEDLGPDRLTAHAHGQFDLLRARVQRMERLIDGLLQYSRVGRTAPTIEWVDVGQLVGEVIDWVGAPPGIRVTVAPGMPAFNADRLRLGQVLANLIGNAVKHHGNRNQGWIRVTCTPVPSRAGAAGGVGDVPDQFEFAVADDGPGIDPRYHERIFGVFQTLERRDKVEGTGIGLALVRKVVTAKGGTVRVESTVGGGATFRFTWPRVDPGAPPRVPAVASSAAPFVSRAQPAVLQEVVP